MTRIWHNLSNRTRTTLTVLALAELACTAIAATDLARRSPSQVRGAKAAWWPVLFVQPIGAPAYLLWGRRP
ncbi:MAG: PLDc N-terminal domain-containing protein [Actinomycetota bacterium]|nr:PLDc N-terminal domain-containing protein [Actinomycetota bacterium]